MIVKGATMLRVWGGAIARPTRDIDFLGRVEKMTATLEEILRECVEAAVPEDGLVFEQPTVHEQITLDGQYPGVTAKVHGNLAGARFVIKIDVGIGDATEPQPGWVDFPVLLDGPAPKILAYQPETSIAEKLESIVSLGLINSRLKDYYDIWMLLTTRTLSRDSLANSIEATFKRRRTAIPIQPPVGLTSEFTVQETSVVIWKAFRARLKLSNIEAPESLEELVAEINHHLEPVFNHIYSRGSL